MGFSSPGVHSTIPYNEVLRYLQLQLRRLQAQGAGTRSTRGECNDLQAQKRNNMPSLAESAHETTTSTPAYSRRLRKHSLRRSTANHCMFKDALPALLGRKIAHTDRYDQCSFQSTANQATAEQTLHLVALTNQRTLPPVRSSSSSSSRHSRRA